MEGEMETTTEQGQRFVEFTGVRRPELTKRPTNLKLEGELEHSTVNRISFCPRQMPERRQLLRRKSTNLKLEGEPPTIPTEYRQLFLDFPRERPVRRRPAENLRPFEGEMEKVTEKRAQFVDFSGIARRPEPHRRSGSLKIEKGSLKDILPEYRESYVEFPAAGRPPPRKYEDTLKLEGPMLIETEKKAQYRDFSPVKHRRRQPPDDDVKYGTPAEDVTQKYPVPEWDWESGRPAAGKKTEDQATKDMQEELRLHRLQLQRRQREIEEEQKEQQRRLIELQRMQQLQRVPPANLEPVFPANSSNFREPIRRESVDTGHISRRSSIDHGLTRKPSVEKKLQRRPSQAPSTPPTPKKAPPSPKRSRSVPKKAQPSTPPTPRKTPPPTPPISKRNLAGIKKEVQPSTPPTPRKAPTSPRLSSPGNRRRRSSTASDKTEGEKINDAVEKQPEESAAINGKPRLEVPPRDVEIPTPLVNSSPVLVPNMAYDREKSTTSNTVLPPIETGKNIKIGGTTDSRLTKLKPAPKPVGIDIETAERHNLKTPGGQDVFRAFHVLEKPEKTVTFEMDVRPPTRGRSLSRSGRCRTPPEGSSSLDRGNTPSYRMQVHNVDDNGNSTANRRNEQSSIRPTSAVRRASSPLLLPRRRGSHIRRDNTRHAFVVLDDNGNGNNNNGGNNNNNGNVNNNVARSGLLNVPRGRAGWMPPWYNAPTSI